jgi:YfiH family protein
MERFSLIEDAGAAVAAMSGVADGDCGRHGDAEARARFLARCGAPPAPALFASQVHGVRILRVDAAAGAGESLAGEADGLMTDAPDAVLCVGVADCVPVWLFDPVTWSGALLHAGREGSAAGICAAGVRALQEAYGAQPGDLLAQIGPSAGPCCYEVSPEMAADYRGRDFPVQGRHLDLWALNTRQLVSAGVPPPRIAVSGECTICGDRFFSFRRNNSRERNLAVLRLGAGPNEPER